MASHSRVCKVCGKQINIDNRLGVCRRTEACALEYRRIWKLEHRKFCGLDPKTRKRMWHQQGEVCYLCQRDLPWEDAYLDHDHAHRECGGKGCPECVRGLAHSKCNLLIGQLFDSVETIRAIADNLERALAVVRSRWSQ